MAATPAFRSALDRVVDETRRQRLCLMCAEREPLECHRCLLVARALAKRGLAPGHILADGTVEPHAATEERLLGLGGRSRRPVRRPHGPSRRRLSAPRPRDRRPDQGVNPAAADGSDFFTTS